MLTPSSQTPAGAPYTVSWRHQEDDVRSGLMFRPWTLSYLGTKLCTLAVQGGAPVKGCKIHRGLIH